MAKNNPASRYLVLGKHSWNRRIFDEQVAGLPGTWTYLDDPEQLTAAALAEMAPRYLFFLHWSHRVPEEVIARYECVCFHMTDVPYGRGGSPLQNLIVRGHRETMLTALRMVEAFDAGPVYLKEKLSLEGNAEEILIRATELSARMIAHVAAHEPEPTPQSGDVVTFKRRRPEQSEISAPGSLTQVYDFIRMLDAEGYPPAFIVHEGFRYSFRRAARYDGRIVADVIITPEDDPQA